MLGLALCSNKLLISFKFKSYWFFHRLMMSEKNINKSNIKWFTRSCNWICCRSVFTKKNFCCDQNLLCFVSIYLPRCCLVLAAYNKRNIPCPFLFNIEIIHPQSYNVQLHFTSLNISYHGWIISDIKKRHGIFAYYLIDPTLEILKDCLYFCSRMVTMILQ